MNPKKDVYKFPVFWTIVFFSVSFIIVMSKILVAESPTSEEIEVKTAETWGEEIASLNRGDLIVVKRYDKEKVLIFLSVNPERIYTRSLGLAYQEGWRHGDIEILRVVKHSDRRSYQEHSEQAVMGLLGPESLDHAQVE